jgi:hypothetical protein
MICEYEAPDAEAARKVGRTASMPFERIWTAMVFDWDERQRRERQGRARL